MISSQIKVVVRFAETDAMGVVYHANYLPWFEIARTALIAQIGLPYTKLQSQGYHLPVLEANVKYKLPAKYDDELLVTATIKEMPALRIRIEYTVHRGNEMLTTGTTTHVFMNNEGHAIRPPEFVIETFKKYF
ncbi:MAG: acyl-CoA thioesterase [Opitutales bacterium]|nr:acyl-CoA thioesterase [Opitutales bacterium]